MSIYDMLLANAMGESGGGGGSSDFSTAQVTITVQLEEGTSVRGRYPVVIEEEGFSAMMVFPFDNGISRTETIPLYKGTCYFEVDDATTLTGTGGVSVEGGYAVFVTGDGTLTVSNL